MACVSGIDVAFQRVLVKDRRLGVKRRATPTLTSRGAPWAALSALNGNKILKMRVCNIEGIVRGFQWDSSVEALVSNR